MKHSITKYRSQYQHYAAAMLVFGFWFLFILSAVGSKRIDTYKTTNIETITADYYDHNSDILQPATAGATHLPISESSTIGQLSKHFDVLISSSVSLLPDIRSYHLWQGNISDIRPEYYSFLFRFKPF